MFDKGVALLAEGRPADALDEFQESLATASGDQKADSLYNIATCHIRLGNTEKALQVIAEALDLDPTLANEVAADDDFGLLAVNGQFVEILKEAKQKASSIAEDMERYVRSKVGVSRTALNVRAAIGIFVFGWLMMMNYNDLGEKGLGWVLAIAMAFVFAFARYEPMVVVIGAAIYGAAWLHTNSLLSKKQNNARAEYLGNKLKLAE